MLHLFQSCSFNVFFVLQTQSLTVLLKLLTEAMFPLSIMTSSQCRYRAPNSAVKPSVF